MHVLDVAWRAVGAPAGDDGPLHRCARCGEHAQLSPTRRAVSKTFTAFDNWHDPAGPGLCPACAWGYTGAELRSRPCRVTQSGSFTLSSPAEVTELLCEGRLDPATALTVPLRPGRKHLLPEAQWGRVRLDNISIGWTAADARRLNAVRRLRAAGFGNRMIIAPAPAWGALNNLPRAQWPAILRTWIELDPWRPTSPWLALAVHITRQENQ